MFLTVNHFQMFKPGSVHGRGGAMQIQTKEQIESIRIASNLATRPWLEMAKEGIVHIRTCKATKWILLNIKLRLFTENIQM